MINDTLDNYFPCPLCWGFGYLLAIFTLGLSLCCPAVCVRDAEYNVIKFIDSCNRKRLANKNIKLYLRKKCGTSWLEWHLPPPTKSENNPALLDLKQGRIREVKRI